MTEARLLYQQEYDKLTQTNVLALTSIWDHPCFVEAKFNMKERNEFITKPCDVDEGIFTCRKCNSKKTYSYSRQVRSSDEAIAVFVSCAICEFKWREA